MVTDTMVAEKVMGWHLDNPTVLPQEWCDKYGFPADIGYPWTPTTDISQAFQVVERMRELGFYFMLTEMDEWHAYFRKCEMGEDGKPWLVPSEQYHGNADTPALAICEAALAAIKEA